MGAGRWHGQVLVSSQPLSFLVFQRRALFLANDYFFTDISDTPFR